MEDKISLPANPENQERVLKQVLGNLDALNIKGSEVELLSSAYRGINFVIESIRMLRKSEDAPDSLVDMIQENGTEAA